MKIDTSLSRVRLAGFALASVLVLAGCAAGSLTDAERGSGAPAGAAIVPGSAVAGSAPSNATGTASAAEKAAVVPPTESALAAIVLQTADLPVGWSGSAPDPNSSGGNDDSDQALLQCLGGKDTSPDVVAESDSDDFSFDDADVSSSATSFQLQSDIDSDTAMVQNPKASGCLEQMIESEAQSGSTNGATLSNVSFTVAPDRTPGDPANVVAIGSGVLTVSASGQQVDVYVSMAFIVGPLIEAEVDFENPGEPVPDALFRSLVNAVAARAAKG